MKKIFKFIFNFLIILTLLNNICYGDLQAKVEEREAREEEVKEPESDPCKTASLLFRYIGEEIRKDPNEPLNNFEIPELGLTLGNGSILRKEFISKLFSSLQRDFGSCIAQINSNQKASLERLQTKIDDCCSKVNNNNNCVNDEPNKLPIEPSSPVLVEPINNGVDNDLLKPTVSE